MDEIGDKRHNESRGGVDDKGGGQLGGVNSLLFGGFAS